MTDKTRLPAQDLRWRVDEDTLPFRSTQEVDAAVGIIGQPVAMEAMRFGVESDAPGQNIYVRGTSGTGRTSLVRVILSELKPRARRRLDRCYVHNFQQPDRPQLITLPGGTGPQLRKRIRSLAEFVEKGFHESFESEPIKSRTKAMATALREKIQQLMAPLEKELQENQLALVQLQSGPVSRTAIFPLIDGKPAPPEELNALLQEGKVDQAFIDDVERKVQEFAPRVQEKSREANRSWQEGLEEVRQFTEREARAILRRFCDGMLKEFPQDDVREYIDAVISDVVENRLDPQAAQGQPPPTLIYGVNVVCSHDGESSPVITENTPSIANLLGSVEPEFLPNGQMVTNYRGVRAGTLVHADGGYLILDAHDVLTEPGAWRTLMRALRTGSVEMVPPEAGWPFTTQSIKPAPIDIRVRVILIGDSDLYYQLDAIDQDFSNQFKVLADFDSEIERTDQGVDQYAQVVARICLDEDLKHFDAGGVAALAEHGARIAARSGKISARFGRIADIVREADFLATRDQADQVSRQHVEQTVARTKYRASLPATRFQEMVRKGTLLVRTTGSVVGQINGLAVIHAGPLSYGFPARITATVGAGRAGVINIEGASSMSGAIHTKGFHILGGLMRHLLKMAHPMAFSASIAFEQSYGGIDGDSASGAEICCLLSALSGIPIRQEFAMTGAIDQHGHVQAIGGVNEKIEGFFDTCANLGLSGNQGVIIPSANAGDLMLRKDVVAACEEGRFHVHAVSEVTEALDILTGMSAGKADPDGHFPQDSLLGIAQARVTDFWRKTLLSPSQFDNGQSEPSSD